MSAPTFYRNKKPVFTGDSEIESECLWQLQGNKLHLVDDDWHAVVSLDEEIFYKLEKAP
ncbi:hypothetical protein ACLI1A_10075 [Flavobacterium sp. RHBU_3]|uniref:hypothetical protein n=1 Tax=Flavobacterium sp. RHBU_3 TaxID=3391184 RepID=UPI00398501F5